MLSNFNDPNASLCVFSPPSSLRDKDDQELIDEFPTLRTAGPADPRLKILSKVPHDEKIGGLTLRITALKGGPFISSFKLLPCVVDALSTAFNSVWNEIDQHQPLQDDEYMCSHHALTLILRSNKKPLKGMEYSDLVTLARLLLSFQQVYMLPGISFDYLEDGVKTGSGDIDWNQAESSLQGLEQA